MEENKKIENPAAFPVYLPPIQNGDEHIPGMTLRDYFAAKAIQGFCSNQEFLKNLHADVDDVSISAYEIADAMLKYRSNNPEIK